MEKTFRAFVLFSVFMAFTACKNEFEIIRASGDWRKQYEQALEYYKNDDYLKASTLFELVIPQLRGQKEAEEVYFKYAYSNYYLAKYILASHYFKNFASTFPNSEFREEADYMSAYSNYQMSPTFRLDQANTEKAIEGFQIFVNTYPESERVKECNRLIDELRSKQETKVYQEALLYYNLRQYQSSIQVFENLLKDFPETANAEQVRYMTVKSTFLLAENSVLAKRKERYDFVISRYKEFIVKYPKSKLKKELDSYNKIAVKKVKELSNV